MENTFGSMFFTVKKNIENTKSREQEKFPKNTKILFSMFPKTVLKYSFKKQEPNRPLVCLFSFFISRESNRS